MKPTGTDLGQRTPVFPPRGAEVMSAPSPGHRGHRGPLRGPRGAASAVVALPAQVLLPTQVKTSVTAVCVPFMMPASVDSPKPTLASFCLQTTTWFH